MLLLLGVSLLLRILAAGQERAQDEVIVVAVADFQNNAGKEYDYLIKAIPNSILTNLANVKQLKVVEREQLAKALEELGLSKEGVVDEGTAAKVGRFLGATVMILGDFFVIENEIRINARLVDVKTSLITAAEMVRGPRGREIFALIDRLSSLILKDLTAVVGETPTASFSYRPSNPVSGEEVVFDASGSADPDGAIVKYEWDFDNDGVFDARGPSASYRFPAGDHMVRLTVTDKSGMSDSIVKTVRVSSPNYTNQLPVARFSFSPANPTEHDTVVFDASASRDPDGSITSYAWDFDGDERIDAQGVRAIYQFSSEGSHPVTLTIVDNRGGLSKLSYVVEVRRPANGATFFLSGGIGLVGRTHFYKGAFGIPLSPETAGELGFGYGESQLLQRDYPLILKLTAVDLNVLYRVIPSGFVGGGVGALVISGEYKIDWPVEGSKSFTYYSIVVNLKIGYQIGFLVLSAGISYPVVGYKGY